MVLARGADTQNRLRGFDARTGVYPLYGVGGREERGHLGGTAEAPDSWQIEALHRYGGITLTGGHADYLFGHWRKRLKKGERFCTRTAYFTCVEGDLTKACAALTRYHETRYRFPESESSLPVVYNEYLCSWGNPTMENVRGQLELARRLGAEYFVIDAGWFGEDKDGDLGDWAVNRKKFPGGLKEFSRAFRAAGFKAGGVWYEFESVTARAEVSRNTDWLLKEDGVVIDHDGRMFFDFRKAQVTDYLRKKVIDALNESGLNYIKIDYNENIGLGADGAESPGEGLRAHVEEVVRFFRALREEVPGLVMEICSSGGMRHDPVFLTLGSMVSFSDAHENADGAVVAIDLHRVMQPRTMQIWASILPEQSPDEVYFTMIKAMMGRICLSGKLLSVSEEVLGIVRAGVEYYFGIRTSSATGRRYLSTRTKSVPSAIRREWQGSREKVRTEGGCSAMRSLTACRNGRFPSRPRDMSFVPRTEMPQRNATVGRRSSFSAESPFPRV